LTWPMHRFCGKHSGEGLTSFSRLGTTKLRLPYGTTSWQSASGSWPRTTTGQRSGGLGTMTIRKSNRPRDRQRRHELHEPEPDSLAENRENRGKIGTCYFSWKIGENRGENRDMLLFDGRFSSKFTNEFRREGKPGYRIVPARKGGEARLGAAGQEQSRAATETFPAAGSFDARRQG
jgi:hypothetical protein